MLELFSHWEQIRAGHLAPHRADIDPHKIENVLEHAFILEQPANGTARFRIAGMRLVALMGMELRGMPATAAIAPQSRDYFCQRLTQVFNQPEIVEMTLSASPAGGGRIGGGMLLLPMYDDRACISRLLGCLVTTGSAPTSPLHPAPPLRFAVTACKTTRIVSNRSAPNRRPPNVGTLESVSPPLSGFSEAQDAFIPPVQKRPSAAASHLRLVSSRD